MGTISPLEVSDETTTIQRRVQARGGAASGAGGHSAAALARELGVPHSKLHKWKTEVDADGEAAFPGSGRRPKPVAELERLKRENARLREENEIFKKSREVLCQGIGVKYAFIQAQASRYPVMRLCAVLRVSRSGYYARAKREISPRVKTDRVLSSHIARVHSANRGAYGTMRIWQALCQSGVACGKHRVRRLRRALGLQVKRVKRFRVARQSRQRQRQSIVASVLEQRFAVERPNRVCAGDITCLPTARGFLFLAVVLDLFARRVVGWSMANRMDTELTLRALMMALDRRRPQGALLHHSDQGCQYTSRSYQQVLQQHGIEPSMSRRGNCYDNACVESFFSTLKNELIHDRQYRTRDEARRGATCSRISRPFTIRGDSISHSVTSAP